MAREDLGGIVLALGLSGLGAAYLLFGSRRVSAPRGGSAVDAGSDLQGQYGASNAIPFEDEPFLNVAGERVLIFGDSLSHPGANAAPTVVAVDLKDRGTLAASAPGAVLAARLLTGGDASGAPRAAVRLNARVGRSAQSFLSREGAARLFADDTAWRPTKVIVMLGTNDIDRGMTVAVLGQTKDAMRKIRDLSSDGCRGCRDWSAFVSK